MERKTKIVCTFGPATTANDKIIGAIIEAGMDVARLNFSHGTHEEHKSRLDKIRKISHRLGKQVAIMADLQGPKIRLGKFHETPLRVANGQKFVITTDAITGDKNRASSSFKKLPHDVSRGDTIFLNDGLVKLEVEKTAGNEVFTRVIEGGEIGDHKGINLPGVTLSTAGLTTKDKRDLEFAVAAGVDIVALSFVRTAADIRRARHIIDKAGSNTPIIAKIEKHEAITNLEEIIEAADGVMVARGDLGVEMPLEEVPTLQKRIITLANLHHKPVITATQMLESMIENPRPTRAEVSDVANAIIDGTDAVMLSAETAVGKHPVEAVETMAKIALYTEASFSGHFTPHIEEHSLSVSESVARAACQMADNLGARAIIAFTESGFTARLISSFRPRCLVLGVTKNLTVARRLALLHGVWPVVGDEVTNIDHMIEHAVDKARRMKVLEKGDIAVITAGVPLAITGATNLIKAHIV